MKRVPGVSYIELFVSMAIFAILSLMAMPNFIGWRQREAFKSQVTEIFQTINTARVNALSERTCDSADGPVTTQGWSLDIDHEQMTLRCHRPDGSTDDLVLPYTSGLKINPNAMHYYGNHNYTSVFYAAEPTVHPSDLFRMDADGEYVSSYEDNPNSLSVVFEPGSSDTALGDSPKIRGFLLPMYLPNDSSSLKSFICLDRMAGVPFFCTEKYSPDEITSMNLTN